MPKSDNQKAKILYIMDYLEKNIPQIKTYAPDAPYLMWLDCRALGMAQKDLIDALPLTSYCSIIPLKRLEVICNEVVLFYEPRSLCFRCRAYVADLMLTS